MSRKHQSTTDSTETTAHVSEAPEPTSEQPTSGSPVTEPDADHQKFADRVGQKKWVPGPDPFPIAEDYLAGVELFESNRDRQMAIQFGKGQKDAKPSQAVIDKMNGAGCKWKPADRIWALPITAGSAMRTRIDAERLFQEVSKMIRQEKGIEGGQDIPF